MDIRLVFFSVFIIIHWCSLWMNYLTEKESRKKCISAKTRFHVNDSLSGRFRVNIKKKSCLSNYQRNVNARCGYHTTSTRISLKLGWNYRIRNLIEIRAFVYWHNNIVFDDFQGEIQKRRTTVARKTRKDRSEPAGRPKKGCKRNATHVTCRR